MPYLEMSALESAVAGRAPMMTVTFFRPVDEIVLDVQGRGHFSDAAEELARSRCLAREASEALERIEELERAKARVEAELLEAYSWLADVQDEQFARSVTGPREHVAAEQLTIREIALATGVGEREVSRRMAVATDPERHAHACAELAAGATTLQRVLQIAEATGPLPADAVAHVEQTVLAPGRDGGPVSAATFRRRLRRSVAAADPRGRQQRHADATARRTAYGRLTEDGMGVLTVVDTAERVVGMLDRADAAARALRAGGDPRTLEQLRADVVGDAILFGDAPDGTGGPPPATVRIVVPFEVAVGGSDAPCELPGHGWVTAAHARRIMTAQGSTWQRLAVEVDSGRMLELSTESYRPTAAMVAAVRARDGVCRGPGCQVPADRCDLDHQQPWPAGATHVDNLVAASRGCHNPKTARLWTSRLQDDGGLRWTTLAGREYVTYPRDWREAVRESPPPGRSAPRAAAPPGDDPPPF